jgi:hypothetical protein
VTCCSSAVFEPYNWESVEYQEPSPCETIAGSTPSFLSFQTLLSVSAFKVFWTIPVFCRYCSHATTFFCQRQGDFKSSTRVLLQVDHPLFSFKEAWRQSGVSTSSLSETLSELSKRYSESLCSMLPIRLQMGMS